MLSGCLIGKRIPDPGQIVKIFINPLQNQCFTQLPGIFYGCHRLVCHGIPDLQIVILRPGFLILTICKCAVCCLPDLLCQFLVNKSPSVTASPIRI